MIKLTQNNIHKDEFYLNNRGIRKIYKTHQTVIVMEDKEKYYVLEEPEEVIKKIKEFEASILDISNINKGQN